MDNSYNKSEPMNGGAPKLPKNIRQIGYIGGSKRIVYVEDYVMTFMKQLSQKEHTGLRVAVLLGYYIRTEEGKNLFVKGAVEMKEADLNSGTTFSDEGWTSVYENIKKYFSDVEIVGWSLVGPGFFIDSTETIRKMHINNFQGTDKVLLKVDSLEKEEAFYLYENNQLIKQTGYYIYYEKNEEMQNYMVENKEEIITEEKEYDDKTTQKIRAVIQEKKEPKEEKGVIRLMYAASTLLAIIVLVIAATMLKNYEQMRKMEVAINTLSDSFRNTEKANTIEPSDTVPVLNVVTNETNETKETKTANNEQVKENETVVIETVAGNVEPTEEVEDPDEVTETSEDKKATDSASNDTEIKETEKSKEETEAPKETAPKETEPEPTKSEAVETAAEPKYYVVKPGESLAGICFKLYNSANNMNKIKELNGIENEDKIYAGQKLMVP